MADEMISKQMQFIKWLITMTTDKCQTIEEVKEINREIRKHSDGLIDEIEELDKFDIKKVIEWCDKKGQSEHEILDLIRRIVGANPYNEEQHREYLRQ